jgi:glutaminyl-tRNA synthetase
MPDAAPKPSTHFIQDIINADNASGKHGGRVHTRFPPEPNGYLHIGHAKSIHLNFGLARQYGGLCNLRFDDTNPAAEDVEYVESIQEDVRWLGFDWEDRLYYASDYFERLYGYAEYLIEHGDAYVCDLSNEEMGRYRGTVTEPGRPSPWRDRPVAENLELFRAMRAGAFPDGARVLRAKIDMASPNMLMRDPVLYRIKREHHHRTGDAWCVYPMYDYAHPISDAIEGITHSICTLEFEDHRPFYDWVLERLPDLPHPQQIEFARLNLSHTLMSKRKLLELVDRKLVTGWDDPRLPTIAGLRRRGYTPEAIKVFAETIGVAKRDSTVSAALLEYCLREDLNRRARRVMAVLHPLKVVIENYPEGEVEWFDAENNPEDASAGSRKLPFSRELWIERDDFKEEAPKKWFRLSPGKEIRLKFAYYITCTQVIKDPVTGEVTELRCTYDPASRGGSTPDGRKVLGTSHWVSAAHARTAEVRLYDKLFLCEDPAAALDTQPYAEVLNPESLVVLTGCRVEPALAEASPDEPLQFLRQGYFCRDRVDGTGDRLVFNRTVTLRDTWAKIEKTT